MSARKAPGERVRRGTLDIGVLPAARRMEPPPAPKGLLRASGRAWTRFWGSPLSSLVIEADLGALERLWRLSDERARLHNAVAGSGQRLVAGPKGEAVMNPIYSTVAKLDAEIRALEDRFGLSPHARLRLGIVLGQAARSLADLAQLADADLDERPDVRLVSDLPIHREEET